MSRCVKCNTAFEKPTKFCPECGTEQPIEKVVGNNDKGSLVGDKNVQRVS